MIANLPDKNWILVKQGDHRAFEALYRDHYPTLFRYALRFRADKHLADQSIQDLFVRIWEKREGLADVSSPRAYLLTALRRVLLSQKPSVISSSLEINQHSIAFEYSPQDLQIQKETKRICQKSLSRALNQLPERQREAIYLKFYEELSYEETAHIMGVKYQSVLNFVFRGLQALKKDDQLRKVATNELVDIEFVWFLIGICSFILN